MKNLYKTALLFLTTIVAFAQAPQKISYQSVIRNNSNALIVNSTVGMKVSVLQGGENGVSVYSETHKPTTNANGLVSLAIGTGTVVQGIFANIDWSTGSYFVKTEIDPIGGENYTLSGTSELLSVPYALHAKTASNSGGGGMPSGTKVGEMLYWNGTEWVTIPPGINNQTLRFCNGIPTWSPCTITTPIVITTLGSLNLDVFSVGGDVQSDGGSAITARGIVYGLAPNPTLNQPLVNTSLTVAGTGSWSQNLTLASEQNDLTYYYRSFATNGIGTTYGTEYSIFVPKKLKTYTFGDDGPGGGLVFYVDGSKQHGLEAPYYISETTNGTVYDPGSGGEYYPPLLSTWSNGANIITSATGTAIGTGENNTGFIIFNQGSGEYPAQLCYDYVYKGTSDWFLPSIDELYLLASLNIPFLYGGNYWSSTEVNQNEAYMLRIESDISGFVTKRDIVISPKSTLGGIFPVRKF